jgi:hypothetical protein
MEIVSLMRSAYPRASWNREDRDSIWRHYWSGGGALKIEIPIIRNGVLTRQWFESGEIWEYLIEGRLELVDEGDEGAPKTEVSFRRSREIKPLV